MSAHDRFKSNFDFFVQSGIFIILLSGLAFIFGYSYENGVYSFFGIEGVDPYVKPSTYIQLLSNLGLLYTAMLLVVTMKDDFLRYATRPERTKRDALKLFISILGTYAILVLVNYLLAISNGLKHALVSSWNSFGIYLALLLFIIFMVNYLLKIFRNDFLAKADNLKGSLRLLHFSVEGMSLFILTIGLLTVTSLVSEHIGEQSLKSEESYVLITDAKGKKYLSVQDQGDKYLAVRVCKQRPLKLSSGQFKYFPKSEQLTYQTQKLKLTSDSFCK